ncbi:MAG: FAD-dependent oxidoreductase [Saprospiraceae bacterium]|nr:FAD-dependent oxidoreductase [Saprospiraceae bacterium]
MIHNQNIIIIGNGVAGATAALGIRKRSQASITIISDETDFPYARTALMYMFMGQLTLPQTHLYPPHLWKEKNINLIKARVVGLDRGAKTIDLDQGSKLSYDQLILATGSKPIIPNCAGIDLPGVCSLYHIDDLNKIEKHLNSHIKNAVIIGGGLIGVELAEMLFSRGIKVGFVIREASYWANVLPKEESEMVTRHLIERGVTILPNEELSAITGDQHTTGVICKSGKNISCDFVGITIGVCPNVSIFSKTGLSLNQGILTDSFLRTNDSNIYAIGDCAELTSPAENRKSIEAVWYTARKMGEVVAANICGENKIYEQGHWYNSAKFFDLEYQVYGYVPKIVETPYKYHYLQFTDCQKSIRIVYHEEGHVVGFLSMGIRLRQNICESWINEKTQIKEVLQNFDKANFDPEFTPEPYKNLNTQSPGSNTRKGRSLLSFILSFLRNRS